MWVSLKKITGFRTPSLSTEFCLAKKLEEKGKEAEGNHAYSSLTDKQKLACSSFIHVCHSLNVTKWVLIQRSPSGKMFMIFFIDCLKVDDVILCDQLMYTFMDRKYDDLSAPIQEFDQCRQHIFLSCVHVTCVESI